MIFNCLKNIVRKISSEEMKGINLEAVVTFLEQFAPKGIAESWDNTGLLLEPFTKKTVNNILLTNDLTEDVVNEALQIKTDLIISYHPPIFQALKTITNSTWKERILSACLENRIAIYSPHTRWDSIEGGINDWLASVFESDIVTPICQPKNEIKGNVGVGRYCKLKKEIQLVTAVNKIKNLIAQPHLQIALARGANLDTEIKDVAICAGSGSSVLKNFQADLYLTGEMSHHDLLNAIHNGSSVIICNHSNSERGFLKNMKNKLEEQYKSENIQIFLSKNDKDPLLFV